MAQDTAVACGKNHIVKFGIKPGKVSSVVFSGVHFHELYNFGKPGKICRVNALGSPVSSLAFQKVTNGKYVVNVVAGHALHHHAAVWNGYNKIFELKLLKRLTYGGAAYIKLFGQFCFDKVIPSFVTAFDNVIPNVSINLCG